ncbi:MAG: isochorismatase family protein [Verrucomicrobia bacterium]|nr:isochorismatase family protein [Verrucomicrobiota bacterium]
MIPPSPPTGTLLLCIDLQPVFVRAVADGARVQRRCEFAVAAATGLGLPVAFTEQVPQKLGGTAPELLALAPGAPVLAKETFSALASDSIREALLSREKVEHLLLCGIETPICVYQTAIAALAEGLHVTLLSDAIGARRPDDADACLAALRHAGAHVLPSETVFYALLHDVKHPFFKSYTQLVKSHA